jgi:exportin-7
MIEGQIAWIVHIIAAILKVRQTVGCRCVGYFPCIDIMFLITPFHERFFFSCSQESQELIDAELSARVLQLISMTDTGLHAQVG